MKKSFYSGTVFRCQVPLSEMDEKKLTQKEEYLKAKGFVLEKDFDRRDS